MEDNNKKINSPDAKKLQELGKDIKISVREGRKGETYQYISSNNVVKRLNQVFGLGWRDESMKEVIQKDEVAVLVRISYPLEDGTISYKEAWGGKVLVSGTFRITTAEGLKSAHSLAITKAAQKLGIKVLDEEDEITDETMEDILLLAKKVGMKFDESQFETMNEKQGRAIVKHLESKLTK